MIKRPHAVELILGAAEDPVFGPILLVGHGGVAAEVIDDKALALPPLDPVLAEDALSRTRVDRLLRGYRDRPPAARGAVCDALVRLSQLIADVGEIAELDINPLLVDAEGVIALDARIVVRKPHGKERGARFAIRPYPVELETEVTHGGEKLRIRPIRPDDEGLLQAFTKRLTPEDVRMRFFGPLRELSHEMAARLTQIDYDREMAFLLLDDSGTLGRRTAGRRSRFRAGGVCPGRGVGPPGPRLWHAAAQSRAALRPGARRPARDRPCAAREPEDARTHQAAGLCARKRTLGRARHSCGEAHGLSLAPMFFVTFVLSAALN